MACEDSGLTAGLKPGVTIVCGAHTCGSGRQKNLPMTAARQSTESFALIAYFRDEADADKIEALLHNAASRQEALHMTEVNYAEVQYIIIRRNGLAGWEAVADRLVALPISFHPVTRELADTAARLRAAHRINLADASAAALAKVKNAELVTGDRDFKAVEKDLKKIRWIVGRQ